MDRIQPTTYPNITKGFHRMIERHLLYAENTLMDSNIEAPLSITVSDLRSRLIFVSLIRIMNKYCIFVTANLDLLCIPFEAIRAIMMRRMIINPICHVRVIDFT